MMLTSHKRAREPLLKQSGKGREGCEARAVVRSHFEPPNSGPEACLRRILRVSRWSREELVPQGPVSCRCQRAWLPRLSFRLKVCFIVEPLEPHRVVFSVVWPGLGDSSC